MARIRNSLAALGFTIASVAAPAFGDELGTLFYTPKERADFERLRRGESIAGESGYARPDPVITGYVKRSDGKSTVFVDQRPFTIRNGKMQEGLQPRVVQKYIAPLPPPPVVETPPPAAPKAADTPQPRSGDGPRT